MLCPAAKTGFQEAPRVWVKPEEEAQNHQEPSAFPPLGVKVPLVGKPRALVKLHRTVAAPGWAPRGRPCHWLWAQDSFWFPQCQRGFHREKCPFSSGVYELTVPRFGEEGPGLPG